MQLIVLVITNEPSEFEDLKRSALDLVAELVFVKAEYESIASILSEKHARLCCIILDRGPAQDEQLISKMESHKRVHCPWVALVEADMGIQSLVTLSEHEMVAIQEKSKIHELEFLTYLEKQVDLFIEGEVDKKFKNEFERRLIFEYLKNQTLLESISSGVIVTTRTGSQSEFSIQECNQEIGQLLDVDATKMTGKVLSQALTEEKEDGPFYRALDVDVLTLEKREISIVEVERNKYIKRIISPFKGHDGKEEMLGFVWLFIDVTDEVEKGYIDPLTGLMNRRYLTEGLNKEFERIERYGAAGEVPTDLSLIMIDIDNFKLLNDTYGHPEGDRVLKGVADLIKKAVRNVDVACRFGGEEFMVVLPCTPVDKAEVVAQRIRSSVADFEFSNEYNVSISLGVSTDISSNTTRGAISNNELFNHLVDELLEKADGALYEAKRTGKNRVVIAG